MSCRGLGFRVPGCLKSISILMSAVASLIAATTKSLDPARRVLGQSSSGAFATLLTLLGSGAPFSPVVDSGLSCFLRVQDPPPPLSKP